MRITPVLLFLSATLAACSSQGSGSNSSSGNDSAGGPEAQQQAPENLTLDQQNVAVPTTLPSAAPISAIPAAFRGRWAMVAHDCADRTNLLVVENSALVAGGKRIAAGSLTSGGPDALTVGGTAPQGSVKLTLLDAGKTLVREDQHGPDALRYSRCPA